MKTPPFVRLLEYSASFYSLIQPVCLFAPVIIVGVMIMKECMGAIENHESMSGDPSHHLTRSVKAAPKMKQQ